MTAVIPVPIETLEDPDYKKLHPKDILSEVGKGYTTGLNTEGINPNGPKADDVFNFLGGLNYAPLNPPVADIWDCLERALWGIAHTLHRFPGCAIGVAEGEAKVGPASGKDHAVIIIWEKGLGSFNYWDPLLPGKKLKPDEFGPVVRIEAFPSGVGQGDIGKQPAPIDAGMIRIKDGDFVCWKTGYKIYPLTMPNNTGVIDFLKVPLYKTYCPDLNSHQPEPSNANTYWGDRSRALWSYIHVRRVYESCAIGIALGTPEKGKSVAVNVLWYKDGAKYSRKYWDPSPEILSEVSFTPKTIFF